jgi:Membrane bound beta barrel domain (DUF5777)
MKNKVILFLIALSAYHNVFAQTDVDSMLTTLAAETKPKTEYVTHTFASPRVIMGHAVEMLPAGVLDFRILHRFGTVKNGFSDMFGLDYASMRMSFDYGITKNLTVGVGRSTLKKEYDGFLKYRIKQQAIGEKAFPLSILAVVGMSYFTTPWPDPTIKNYNRSRLSYYAQAIVGAKLNSKIALQVAPTFVHRNLVDLASDKNDFIAIGIGGKVKVSRSMSVLVDAYPALSGARSGYNKMPLSLGVDIETGGHVFQLHFSNATGMNEKAFITETTQSWGEAQFSFGFNLSRLFTIKKNKANNY